MKFLILAGGTGTRLWPLSNDEIPKQFHSFLGERTLLQMAYDRLGFANPEDIFVSSNVRYKGIIQEQLPDLSEENIISEPMKRDTAPCISYAMKYIGDVVGVDEVVTIINADQLIVDDQEFHEVVKVAQGKALNENKFVLVSVKTKSPNPNLGYIKINELWDKKGEVEVYGLEKFVEKPNLEKAKEFHNSFKYLWNTAIFTWKISVFMSELTVNAPSIYENLMKITDFSDCETIYSEFEKISIDFALMEKLENDKVVVIPADLGWSDIGTWETLHGELEQDEFGNVLQGEFVVDNVKNCLLINKTTTPAVLYKMENTVCVFSDYGNLVGDIYDSGTLKKLVNLLNDGR
jgi:mannose-1-phosphate guanylyltransferase